MKLLLRVDGGIESFIDQHKLREFRRTKPALQQILKELFYLIKKKATIRNKIVNGKADH